MGSKIINPDVRRLTKLKPGWDGYHGVPAVQSIAEVADIMTLSNASISPMSGGGIQLEWHENGYDIEVAIYEDGTMDATWEKRSVTGSVA